MNSTGTQFCRPLMCKSYLRAGSDGIKHLLLEDSSLHELLLYALLPKEVIEQVQYAEDRSWNSVPSYSLLVVALRST